MNAISSKALGLLTGWFGEGPWRSKSVLAALAAIMIGGAFWLSAAKSAPPQSTRGNAATNVTVIPAGTSNGTHWNWNRPVPFYIPVCASYVAGFCIGWFFRRLIRIAAAIVALAIALLALGRFASCNIKPAQEAVKSGGEWTQHKAAVTRDYLLHLLPSATGGGAGVFWGFRRRSKSVPA